MLESLFRIFQDPAPGGGAKPAGGGLPEPLPPDPDDSRPAMVCREVFEQICVLANGDIVCGCADSLGNRVYGNVHRDRIVDVFAGPLYREIRDWQLRSKADSWCPVVDRDCHGRVSRAAPLDSVAGGKITRLQIEPVSHCNLRCPACPVTSAFHLEGMEHRHDQMPGA